MSSRDKQVERQEMEGEEDKMPKPSSDILEEVQSETGKKPDDEKKGEPEQSGEPKQSGPQQPGETQQPGAEQKPGEPEQIDIRRKNFLAAMEEIAKRNAKCLLDLRHGAQIFREIVENPAIPSDNASGSKTDDNSANDSGLKTDTELSSVNVNLMDSVNNREEPYDCCQRKRIRQEIGSTEYDPEFPGSGLTCIGILPGLGGNIESSDDSDQSCSSASDVNDNTRYDLLGRSLIYERKCSTTSG